LKFKVDYSFLTAAILFYPIALGSVFLFNISPFPITAPYFFLLLLLLLWLMLKREKVSIPVAHSGNFLALALLTLVSILNFSSFRYSLPILFAGYLLVFYWYLTTLQEVSLDIVRSFLSRVFLAYVLISLFFLFVLPHSHMAIGDRFIGFTGSPTTYAAVMATLFLFMDAGREKTGLKRLGTYLLVLLFVYLSKTRLILIFLLLYPFLLFFMARRRVLYRMVYLIFFTTLFFLYGVYRAVVEFFPELITLRYEDGRDASFGLRYYLFELLTNDYFSGSTYEMILGKGNEYSRQLVEADRGLDLFPHNDFYRLMTDWGALGAMLFFVFFYRISGKNRTALMISLLYLILFYSNMVYNLFMVSILLMASFLPMARYSNPPGKQQRDE
jgi:hypothetical protein